ncbi:hypothetical protein [Edaphobacter modestus]|uniref:hypothetical protein n=1 Tax=Edaphobacter modestus TaxID=388466 RepID=UPI00102C0D95|nr:hypothetical protein [Edaphobacter modestus]
MTYHSEPRGRTTRTSFTRPTLRTATLSSGGWLRTVFRSLACRLKTPDQMFRFGRPLYQVDFLPRITGVDFEEAWRDRIMVNIEGNVDAPYISAAQLKQNKRAFGRLKDLADVESIEQCESALQPRKSEQ